MITVRRGPSSYVSSFKKYAHIYNLHNLGSGFFFEEDVTEREQKSYFIVTQR